MRGLMKGLPVDTSDSLEPDAPNVKTPRNLMAARLALLKEHVAVQLIEPRAGYAGAGMQTYDSKETSQPRIHIPASPLTVSPSMF